MWQYIFGAWLFTSLFGDSYEKRRRRYNNLVAKHRQQMDERIENYIRLIKKDRFAETAIADFFEDNLHIFSEEEINYILVGIYQELPEAACRIAKMIDEMPVTPVERGYGIEFV